MFGLGYLFQSVLSPVSRYGGMVVQTWISCMQYVPNGSLWAMRVSNALKLDTKSVIDYALDIASGMLHLHSEDIIHCDLGLNLFSAL